jgi:hypothetical protein
LLCRSRSRHRHYHRLPLPAPPSSRFLPRDRRESECRSHDATDHEGESSQRRCHPGRHDWKCAAEDERTDGQLESVQRLQSLLMCNFARPAAQCRTCSLSQDILVFNPPYVPTPASELLGDGISRSWAGGEKGREVLDLLLLNVQHLLSPRGVFYCVLLSSNLPDEVNEILKREGGFESHMVLRRRAGAEDLQIVRYSRPL